MVEAAEGAHAGIESCFARVTKRRMPEVVRERERFGEIFIKTEHARERTRDLRDFERVRQAGAIVVALMLYEDLGFVFETPERRRVDDAITVALIARPRRAFGFRPIS